jgi:hypothetical protein
MVGKEPMYCFFEAYEAGEPCGKVDTARQLVTAQQRLALVLAMITSRMVIELREITGACFHKPRFYVADVVTGACAEIRGLPHRRWWNPTIWYAPGWDLSTMEPDTSFQKEGHHRNWFLRGLLKYPPLMADLL